jgi:hypothetical protein
MHQASSESPDWTNGLVVSTFEFALERHHQTLRWSLRGQGQNVDTAWSHAQPCEEVAYCLSPIYATHHNCF